jgi:multicomponent Na+:H+ antiporter subunit D
MGIAAALCIYIGCFPGTLYSILPFPVDYEPYAISHVISQLQLLLFSALAFTFLLLSGIYPSEIRAINVDADWLYRKGATGFLWLLDNPLAWFGNQVKTTIWVMGFLLAYLIIYIVSGK